MKRGIKSKYEKNRAVLKDAKTGPKIGPNVFFYEADQIDKSRFYRTALI